MMSRIEEILYSYNEGLSYDKHPQSRIERIVLNLLFHTTYVISTPLSRIEEQLVKLESYIGNKLSRIEEILNIKINGGEYTGEILSRVEDILIGSTPPEPGEWTYESIFDTFGLSILDSNGDPIIGRVKSGFTYVETSDSSGTPIADHTGSPILGRVPI